MNVLPISSDLKKKLGYLARTQLSFVVVPYNTTILGYTT